MYIIPMIAVCGLRRFICKDDCVDVIERLGYLLCTPHREFSVKFIGPFSCTVSQGLITPIPYRATVPM
jgi:hypothetical protein